MKQTLFTCLAITALAALWFHGFLGFVAEVEALQEPEIRSDLIASDAIVVLTGGSERLLTGVKLLENGSGKKLFISGAHRKFSLANITAEHAVSEELRSCCIALGVQAASTVGNAEETKAWMAEQGYTSMRLVTANYHMPRSLALFHAAMPDITIVPHPVSPDSVKIQQWSSHPRTAELLAVEYSKYLVAKFKTNVE